MATQNVTLFSAKSSLNDAGTVVASAGTRETAVYLVWGGGTTVGTIVIETSHSPTYTGTWANLATIPWSAQSKVDVIQMTGAFMAIRVRISVAVSGGTVDAYFVSN